MSEQAVSVSTSPYSVVILTPGPEHDSDVADSELLVQWLNNFAAPAGRLPALMEVDDNPLISGIAVVPVDATVDLVLPESVSREALPEARWEAPPAQNIKVAVEEATLGTPRRFVTQPPIPETMVAKTPASILAQGLPTRSTPAPLVIQPRPTAAPAGRSSLWWAIPLAVVFVAMVIAALYVVVVVL